MTDEQLLEKYKNYTRKRNITVLVIVFLLFLTLLILFAFSSIKEKEKEPVKEPIEPPVEVKEDNIPPVLELTTNSDEVIVESTIDYSKYIKSAVDDIDGDLMDKVEFSKIDSSKVGTYEIVYYVFDSSNNMSQQILTIEIKEKPQESVPPIENNNQSPNTSKPESQKPNTNSSNSNNETKPSEPFVKYFMFTDGYTMNNVVDACAKELKKSNRSGRCLPITDNNGIYLGMKLELD